ncbi:MAG: response regulator [Polyangiales bacterium]
MIDSQPWFDEGLRSPLMDFFSIMKSHIDAVQAVVSADMAKHPVMGKIMGSLPPASAKEQAANARAVLLRCADGEWSAYEQHLRRQGEAYARLDITFVDWFDVVRMFQHAFTPIIVARFADDPVRLGAVLNAMFVFYDRTLAVLGKSYLESKERQIRRSEEILRATINSLHEVVYIADEQGNIVLRNPAAERLSGAQRVRNVFDSGATRSLRRETEDGALEPNRHPMQRALRGEVVVDERLVRVTADGGEQFLSMSAAPIVSDDGAQRGAVATVRDTTLQHQVDEERARAAESEARSRHLAEASRLKSEFLANMSHELRTPLNSIIGFGELLYDGEVGPLESQQREFVGDILTSGRHLLQLINDILDLSKVEAGRMDFVAEPLKLSAVIDEVCSMQRKIARERKIELSVEADPAIDEVSLDGARLKQVLYNFVSNALKFTPEGGTVVVRTRREGAEDFRLEVQDSGIGIAPSDIHRLFVEFQQLRAGASKSHGGTGLGLALTRKLVESQGGSIGVDSELGVGSTFYAILPRRFEEPRRARSSANSSTDHTSKRKILVVADDPSEGARIQLALAKHHFDARLCASGGDALSLLRESAFDAVLLDLVLPDMHGLEAVRRIRALASSNGTPVVLLTIASADTSCALEVSDVVAKPCEEDALIESLARVGVQSPSNVFVIDDDELAQRLMAVAIERAGYAATRFSDASSALSAIEREAPSAVVLDLQMPSMDGFAFLHALRANERFARLPVIVWTVLDLSKQQLDALQSMAQSVIRKDGTTVGIVRALDACLGATMTTERA